MKSRDFLDRQWEYECMGCAIGDGSISVPGGLIQRTAYFLIHQDPLIPLPGFIVIASARHIQSISAMEEAEYQELAWLIWQTNRAIRRVTGITSLTIVQEESSPHFHLWFFPWTDQVIAQYGRPSLSKIRDIMAFLRDRPLSAEEWDALNKTIMAIGSQLNNLILPVTGSETVS